MIALTRCITLAATAAAALHAAPAAAEDKASFVFTALAPPHNGFVHVTGVYQDKAIGYYAPADAYEGFVWSAGNYTLVPAAGTLDAVSDSGVAVGITSGSTTSYTTYDIETGATNVIDFGPSGGSKFLIGGINNSGTIAATQLTTVMKKKPRTACQPFEQDNDGSYKWLAAAELAGLGAIGLTDDGVVVMQQTCGDSYRPKAYLFKDGKKKIFTIAGATNVDVNFVAGSGFGGGYYNNVTQQFFGFTSTGAKSSLITYTPPPGSIDMSVQAIGPHHEVAGYTVDAKGYFHGFIYANKTNYAINYPHYKSTIITGFSSTGAIVGYFGDQTETYGYPTQPFIATCPSDGGCTK